MRSETSDIGQKDFGQCMFKNYFKIAVRNLARKKAYSAITVFGLALGMACCLLILLYVRDELSYDRYHKNAGRIYRVVQQRNLNGQVEELSRAPFQWLRR